VNVTASPILESLLGSRLRAKLLGWLFSHPGERFFVRQLAGLLGEDSTNLSRELARLGELGLLTVSREGQQKYFQVDQESAIYPELRGLVLKTAGLAAQLREAMKPLASRIDLAFVYGSVASGNADALGLCLEPSHSIAIRGRQQIVVETRQRQTGANSQVEVAGIVRG
jgi:DNA-binding transcriptional ArsR family regulator